MCVYVFCMHAVKNNFFGELKSCFSQSPRVCVCGCVRSHTHTQFYAAFVCICTICQFPCEHIGICLLGDSASVCVCLHANVQKHTHRNTNSTQTFFSVSLFMCVFNSCRYISEFKASE